VQRDEELRVEVRRVRREEFQVYGVRKVWRQRNREGHAVARCTVARMMREMGLFVAVRGRRFKTTVPADVAHRPVDLVERDSSAERPNRLWVSDFTYVVTWRGFVYVAFVIDTFSRRIEGVLSSVHVRGSSRVRSTPPRPAAGGHATPPPHRGSAPCLSPSDSRSLLP
jgi:putative transposase